jgi:polar amino acid transport system permease protein
MLVLLFIAFFGLPSIGISVPGHVAMMGSLGLIAGAYLAEIFRGALAGVQHEEVEAALAAGFTRWQALISIEIPQMLRMAVPSMVNEFTTVLKYTPFAYTVGIPEIMKQATAAVSTTLQGVEIYAMAGVLYFVIYRLMLVCVRLADRHFTIPGLSSI